MGLCQQAGQLQLLEPGLALCNSDRKQIKTLTIAFALAFKIVFIYAFVHLCILSLIYFVCVCTECICKHAHVEVRGQLAGPVLSFHHEGPGYRTLVIRLGVKHFH